MLWLSATCNDPTPWASCQIRKIAGCACAVPGMPGTFSPPSLVSDPDMHLGTCVTHVLWCMLGLLTSGFLWSRWRGKRFRHSRAHAQPAILLYLAIGPLLTWTTNTSLSLKYRYEIFLSLGNAIDTCIQGEKERVDCGYYGIKSGECADNDCCWMPSDTPGTPWCFHPIGMCSISHETYIRVCFVLLWFGYVFRALDYYENSC